MRENPHSSPLDAPNPPGRTDDGTPSLQDAPTVREMRNFAQWWNELVPEKPVDPKLFVNPHAFRDENFRGRFPEICGKARSLIQAGADISLGRIVRKDPQSGLYGFESMLLGDWDWMIKPKKGKPNDDWIGKYA